ncbi:hypothetical protein ACLIA0_14205 [Bacillaceae bacterium W0354]
MSHKNEYPKMTKPYGNMMNVDGPYGNMMNNEHMTPYGKPMYNQHSPCWNMPQYGHMPMQNPSYYGNMDSVKPQLSKKDMYDMCHKHHLHFVHMHTNDGKLIEGIIDEVDEEGVTLLTPCGDMARGEDDREERPFGAGYEYGAFGPGYGGFGPGYGYGGYGPGYGYGYGGYPRRFRRFRRNRFPFSVLSGLMFPFFF